MKNQPTLAPAIVVFGIVVAGWMLLDRPKQPEGREERPPEQRRNREEAPREAAPEVGGAVAKGLQWLSAAQGDDGSWAEDIRLPEPPQAGSTALVLRAFVHNRHSPEMGAYAPAVARGLEFVLAKIEESSEEDLQVDSTGVMQPKLGKGVPVYLIAMLLAELEGTLRDASLGARVRAALEKCVRKIERSQLAEGSWNISGWAPILGTSLASRALAMARQKSVAVNPATLDRVGEFTRGAPAPLNRGEVSNATRAGFSVSPSPLYHASQELEQLSRTDHDRKSNAARIAAISQKLSDENFVRGFLSRPDATGEFLTYGGEEFLSFLNISESLRRAGGEAWEKWNLGVKKRLVRLQNADGSWVGHHCVSGRIPMTSVAILTLVVDRQPAGSK